MAYYKNNWNCMAAAAERLTTDSFTTYSLNSGYHSLCPYIIS